MSIKKAVLMLAVFSLAIAGPLFLRAKESAPANNVTGKVQILNDSDEYAWAEFEAYEAKNSQPANGSFHYWLEDGSEEIYVDVVYVKVDGEYAWFAGKCSKASGELVGRWLFLAAHDGGDPGRLVDHIWWEWLPDTADAQAVAERKVNNLKKPASNKSIKAGNVVVNFYDEEE